MASPRHSMTMTPTPANGTQRVQPPLQGDRASFSSTDSEDRWSIITHDSEKSTALDSEDGQSITSTIDNEATPISPIYSEDRWSIVDNVGNSDGEDQEYDNHTPDESEIDLLEDLFAGGYHWHDDTIALQRLMTCNDGEDKEYDNHTPAERPTDLPEDLFAGVYCWYNDTTALQQLTTFNGEPGHNHDELLNDIGIQFNC